MSSGQNGGRCQSASRLRPSYLRSSLRPLDPIGLPPSPYPAYIPGDGVEYTPSPRVPEVAQISKPWAQPESKFARAFRTPYGVVEQWQLQQIREEKDIALARVGYLEFVIMKLERQLAELARKEPKPQPYPKRMKNRRTQTHAPQGAHHAVGACKQTWTDTPSGFTPSASESSSQIESPNPIPHIPPEDKVLQSVETQTVQQGMETCETQTSSGIISTSDSPTQTDGPILICPEDKDTQTGGGWQVPVETQTEGIISTSDSPAQTDGPILICPEDKDMQTGGGWQVPVETQTEGITSASDIPAQTDEPDPLCPEDKDTQTGGDWQVHVQIQTEDKGMKSCRTQTTGTASTSDCLTQTDGPAPPENKDTQIGEGLGWPTTTETQTETRMKSHKTQTPPPPPPEPFFYFGTPALPLSYAIKPNGDGGDPAGGWSAGEAGAYGSGGGGGGGGGGRGREWGERKGAERARRSRGAGKSRKTRNAREAGGGEAAGGAEKGGGAGRSKNTGDAQGARGEEDAVGGAERAERAGKSKSTGGVQEARKKEEVAGEAGKAGRAEKSRKTRSAQEAGGGEVAGRAERAGVARGGGKKGGGGQVAGTVFELSKSHGHSIRRANLEGVHMASLIHKDKRDPARHMN
ncbi:hypothetical protein DUNSADRAFT_47 [Dunaliella salina]|uniref:Uncharacterized protein n=1 Tax=Dunaliella salina TaxID=3046 RepID=A0ABQ7HAP3_DUNSA|nr:hypothetical protein DUNSADRAFT_47 [Dunaliella salina]|eukprot:KAF5843925.1 hypothetical protein DUNSADRAFT_47 [Dunaliella salina]